MFDSLNFAENQYEVHVCPLSHIQLKLFVVLNERSVIIHGKMVHTESEIMSFENPLVAWGDTRQVR
jgi:hypothetical protein